LQIKTKIVSSHTADLKPVKQEVNGTVILPPLVFPALAYYDTAKITPVKSFIVQVEAVKVLQLFCH
jgi:hypothetical protein